MSYYLTLDAKAVHQAALSLEIPEFELFRLAHAAWYRESACDRYLERHYVCYLFEGHVPVWVRDFARRTMRHTPAPAGVGGTRSSCAKKLGAWLCVFAVTPVMLAADLHRSAPAVLIA
jgi:hypothetical protein